MYNIDTFNISLLFSLQNLRKGPFYTHVSLYNKLASLYTKIEIE